MIVSFWGPAYFQDRTVRLPGSNPTWVDWPHLWHATTRMTFDFFVVNPSTVNLWFATVTGRGTTPKLDITMLHQHNTKLTSRTKNQEPILSCADLLLQGISVWRMTVPKRLIYCFDGGHRMTGLKDFGAEHVLRSRGVLWQACWLHHHHNTDSLFSKFLQHKSNTTHEDMSE